MGAALDLDDAFEIHVDLSPLLTDRGVVAGWACPSMGYYTEESRWASLRPRPSGSSARLKLL
jgi:hypothetical protein